MAAKISGSTKVVIPDAQARASSFPTSAATVRHAFFPPIRCARVSRPCWPPISWRCSMPSRSPKRWAVATGAAAPVDRVGALAGTEVALVSGCMRYGHASSPQNCQGAWDHHPSRQEGGYLMPRVALRDGASINCAVDDYLWPWERSTPVLMMHGFARNATFWTRWV